VIKKNLCVISQVSAAYLPQTFKVTAQRC
jgi:hypothetical protein